MNQERSEEEEKERKRDRKDRGQEADGQYPDHVATFPPAHWQLILLIHDFSLVIGAKLHSEYLGFSLLVANYSRNITFFLHWRSGCRYIPYVH